jgi:RNA polymerase sigma-70 factor (ECF subfamily)
MSRLSDYSTAEGLWAFRQYYDELLGFLTARLGCREQAADVVQETYVRVLSMANHDAVAQPRAFLYKTALNLTVDLFRKQRLRAEHTVDLEQAHDVPSGAPDQEAILEGKRQLQLLREAVAELPPKCRQVFLMHKFMHVPHHELAERLGISKNMVERHVMKALAHCRDRLQKKGLTTRRSLSADSERTATDQKTKNPSSGTTALIRHSDEMVATSRGPIDGSSSWSQNRKN